MANLKIKNMLPGLNALAVERAYLEKTEGSTDPVEQRPGMTLFEFEGDKISRITEYW